MRTALCSSIFIVVHPLHLQVVQNTQQMILDSIQLAKDADGLLKFETIPEEEKKLLSQIKEAATLVRRGLWCPPLGAWLGKPGERARTEGTLNL